MFNLQVLNSHVTEYLAGVIVGLLKDRVEVDDAPDSKRARTKKYIKVRASAVISIDVMYRGQSPKHLYLFFCMY
jgi:hypothetical protein